jgi:DNA-directed RNA polymerase subunit RPC12/RpoP
VKVGQCPSCGAPVEFEAGSARIRVCDHCRTVVARDGAKLESLGKVAELADTESPLRVGIHGKYQGTGFRVAGRIQKSHGAGTWDEWCLQLDDARTAWLSESEGAWNLMFELPQVQAPPLQQVKPLTPFLVGDKRFLVEEVGRATTVSAQGELPDFHEEHPYADATGPSGVFGSIDYGGDQPLMYVGSTVSLGQLGFSASDLQPTPRRQALAQARCTNCNGPLDLKAPDSTKRVACPYCGALIDVSAGKLTMLQLLEKPPYEPRLKLGSKGKLRDIEWTVLAFLIRSCRVEGTRYPWEEYLLWNREQGFRWLMMANGHWTFLTPIPAGECLFGARVAKRGAESFKQFQSVMATTEWVVGECYWEVAQGEQAFASEFVAPPKSLNVDATENEATVTLGEMMTRDEVAKAFGLDPKKLPWPQGVAPAQKNPWSERASSSWKWAGIWGASLVAVFLVLLSMSVGGKYLEKTISVPPDAKAGSPEAMAFSDPFEIKDATPLEVSVSCPELSNSWCGVQVDLVNEKTDEVVSVYAEPSYYFGTDSDGSWSEGSKEASKETDAVEAGTYVMRTTISFDKPVQTYVVKVSGSTGPGACCFLFFLLLLFVYPVIASAAAGSFETRKWQDSVFQPPRFGGAK